jgi:hypothetical protein
VHIGNGDRRKLSAAFRRAVESLLHFKPYQRELEDRGWFNQKVRVEVGQPGRQSA